MIAPFYVKMFWDHNIDPLGPDLTPKTIRLRADLVMMSPVSCNQRKYLKIFLIKVIETTCNVRGKCYDQNFLRFPRIFGEKIGVFLENQCYVSNTCSILCPKFNFFDNFLGEIFLKIPNIGPGFKFSETLPPNHCNVWWEKFLLFQLDMFLQLLERNWMTKLGFVIGNVNN
jgi:hypothetical protein